VQTASSPAAVHPAPRPPPPPSPADTDAVLPGLVTKDVEKVRKIPSTAVGKERFDSFFGPYGKSSIYVVRCADLVLPSCVRCSCMHPRATQLNLLADGRVRADSTPGSRVEGCDEGARDRKKGRREAAQGGAWHKEDFGHESARRASQAHEDTRGHEEALGKPASELISKTCSHALDTFTEGSGAGEGCGCHRPLLIVTIAPRYCFNSRIWCGS
jgi:hypothetical protein